MLTGQRKAIQAVLLAEQRLDAVIGGRLVNASWLSGSLGVSVLQMRLLAQSWSQGREALATALVATVWLAGSLVAATLLTGRRRGAARYWGSGLLLCLLPQLALPVLQPLPVPFWPATLELGLLSGFSSLLGNAWLLQRRPWPAVDERIALMRAALGTMFGLSLVWLLPTWSGLLAILCLLPLIVLDYWPEARAPLPTPGRMVDNWFDLTEGARRWRLQLTIDWLLRGGWWRYLQRRRQRGLVLLASGLAIVLGSVWNAVPTPFASILQEQGTLPTLLWLLLAQALALGLAFVLQVPLRGLLGPSDRLIPERWRSWCQAVALCQPFVMAISLLALGLPNLQAPVWLAISLGLYTLAATAWGILLPRLRPSLSTVIFSQRHLLPPGLSLDQGQLAYERAQEEHVNRFLFVAEGLLTLLLTPLAGWLTARWTVDGLLIFTGRSLLIGLVLLVGLVGLWQMIGYRAEESQPALFRPIPWEQLGEQTGQAPPAVTTAQEQASLIEEIEHFLQKRYYE
ncbi:hypothetical protein [Thermogemmatispora carboxidivorans]|uniref:hypothetical protein n=1 Tax=Thermogemmatispora carboxidivorans TaxID=1382306 RepID=UPI00069B1FFA|nr:hypothetical protein [Thermogemmatispora carboxidivorans]